MMVGDWTPRVFVLLPIATAAVPNAILGIWLLFGGRPNEQVVRRLTAVLGIGGVLAYFLVFAYFLGLRGQPITVHFPPWLEIGEYRADVSLRLDLLSLAYGALSAFLLAIIMRFSHAYLHRDPGFSRFFFLASLLASGLQIVSLAGNMDVLIVGWELVGVCSVLLISFFRQNVRSSENSLRAWATYRFCDIGLLAASAWLHHALGNSEFERLQTGSLPPVSLWIGACVIWATLGKSAQLPMTGWLPRAMEGPTSSSAIFYGALSVHLGPFLLLRLAPLWQDSVVLRVVLLVVGLSTSLYSSGVGRTRADAKTQLGYASVSQLGLMFAEIGMGWNGLALAHACSHAVLRTFQFLRSMSLIHDFQENPLVARSIRIRRRWNVESYVAPAFFRRWYWLVWNGFYLDGLLRRLVVEPTFWRRRK